MKKEKEEKMLVAKVEDIKIKPYYLEYTPKQRKYDECMENYQKYHIQDRYILLDKYGYLVDGYIMYLVLKDLGIPYAEVKRAKGQEYRYHGSRRPITEYISRTDYRTIPTKYVFGVHVNGFDDKERVWRVPLKKQDEMEINVGDIVKAGTAKGTSLVKVTRVEVMDEPPFEGKIKCVFGKFDDGGEENVEMVKSA